MRWRTGQRSAACVVREGVPIKEIARRLGVHELVTIDKKIKIANQELAELVASTGSPLQKVHRIGTSGAARLIGDIADRLQR